MERFKKEKRVLNNTMKDVIHIEDSLEWQKNVRNSLMLDTDIRPVVAYSNFDDFRKANYPRADLYICDRHLPERRGKNPDDETWKSVLSTIVCLHPHSPIVILSSHPPSDFWRYLNVLDAIKKTANPNDFDFGAFRNKIEHYLGLTSGAI
jgi:hypothetical protein